MTTTALRLTVSWLTIAGIALFSAGCGGASDPCNEPNDSRCVHPEQCDVTDTSVLPGCGVELISCHEPDGTWYGCRWVTR